MVTENGAVMTWHAMSTRVPGMEYLEWVSTEYQVWLSTWNGGRGKWWVGVTSVQGGRKGNGGLAVRKPA